jgi:hypothetical protein
MNKSNIASHWYSSQKRIEKGTELSGFPTSVWIKKQRNEETVARPERRGLWTTFRQIRDSSKKALLQPGGLLESSAGAHLSLSAVFTTTPSPFLDPSRIIAYHLQYGCASDSGCATVKVWILGCADSADSAESAVEFIDCWFLSLSLCSAVAEPSLCVLFPHRYFIFWIRDTNPQIGFGSQTYFHSCRRNSVS